MTFYPFSPKTATLVSASTNLIFMIYFNILYAKWEIVRRIIRVLRVTKSQHWSNPTVSGFKPVWTPNQAIIASKQSSLIQKDHTQDMSPDKKKHWMTPIIQCFI